MLLTRPEPEKGRLVLHRAALNGDKHFCHMIVREAAKMEVNVLDQIIDAPDQDGLTPLYMLCERGYRREGDGGDDDSDMELEQALGAASQNALGMTKEVSYDGRMDKAMESIDADELKEMDITKLYWDNIEKEKTEGLQYYDLDSKAEMPQLIDRECTTPSRNQLVNLFIEYGANPNV